MAVQNPNPPWIDEEEHLRQLSELVPEQHQAFMLLRSRGLEPWLARFIAARMHPLSNVIESMKRAIEVVEDQEKDYIQQQIQEKDYIQQQITEENF